MTMFDDVDLASLFDTSLFGVAATWAHPSGTPSAAACTVVVDEQAGLLPEDRGGTVQEREATISVRLNEVTAPAVGGTFTIAAGDHVGVWTVTRFSGRSGRTADLVCHLDTRKRAAAAGVIGVR